MIFEYGRYMISNSSRYISLEMMKMLLSYTFLFLCPERDCYFVQRSQGVVPNVTEKRRNRGGGCVPQLSPRLISNASGDSYRLEGCFMRPANEVW